MRERSLPRTRALAIGTILAAATMTICSAAAAAQGVTPDDEANIALEQQFRDSVERVLAAMEAARLRGDCGALTMLHLRIQHITTEPGEWRQRALAIFRRGCPPKPASAPTTEADKPQAVSPPPAPVESVLDDLTPVVPIFGPGLGEKSPGAAEPADNPPAADRVENLREELEAARQREAERRRKALRQPLKPDEQTLLDLHNRARSQVGSPPLEWDPQLATQAASYGPALAQHGRPVHSPREGRETSRENLLQALPGTSAERMIAVWTAERQHFVPGIFPDVSSTGNWADVGHYTQMVWPETTSVGCAIHRGGRFDWLICRYSPPGNQDGKPILAAPRAPRAR